MSVPFVQKSEVCVKRVIMSLITLSLSMFSVECPQMSCYRWNPCHPLRDCYLVAMK
jgi:hypothetical protein